jgi:hypothetical protein
MASENSSDGVLPTLNDTDADDEATVRGLIPWLPDPHKCDCGAYCEATSGYVQTQAMIMDIWVCPECESRYYRG